MTQPHHPSQPGACQPPDCLRRAPWKDLDKDSTGHCYSWLDGAAKPLARVLDQLTPTEQEAFLKAMDLLETELHRHDTHG